MSQCHVTDKPADSQRWRAAVVQRDHPAVQLPDDLRPLSSRVAAASLPAASRASRVARSDLYPGAHVAAARLDPQGQRVDQAIVRRRAVHGHRSLERIPALPLQHDRHAGDLDPSPCIRLPSGLRVA